MEEGWTESLTEETDRVAELLCSHRPVGGVIPFLMDDMDRAITRDRSVMGRSRSGLVRTVPALRHGATILDDCLERDNLFVHNGPEVPSDVRRSRIDPRTRCQSLTHLSCFTAWNGYRSTWTRSLKQLEGILCAGILVGPLPGAAARTLFFPEELHVC